MHKKYTKNLFAFKYSPHEAITGSSGCLAMDLILPAHFPIKHPRSFPTIFKIKMNKRKYHDRSEKKHILRSMLTTCYGYK